MAIVVSAPRVNQKSKKYIVILPKKRKRIILLAFFNSVGEPRQACIGVRICQGDCFAIARNDI